MATKFFRWRWHPVVLPLYARWWRKLKYSAHAQKEKHQYFSMFMTSTWTQKAKVTVNFLAFPSVNFLKIWRSCNHIHFLWNTLLLLKSVRANLIYLEKLQITEYCKNRVNNLDFLPIQNVRQFYFHEVANYEKISSKESVHIKEFRPK